MAEAVWCPCPAVESGGKRVMITSGRKRRIAQTTSARIESWFQKSSVSSAFFEKPKSSARVNICSAPSSRRAASSSCVRITPSGAPQLLAEEVLSAVAAGHRQVAGAHAAHVREPGQQRGVLVVGMGGDVERAARDLEACQRVRDLAGGERVTRARIGGERGGREQNGSG